MIMNEQRDRAFKSSFFSIFVIIAYIFNLKIHILFFFNFIGDEIPKKDCNDLLDQLVPIGSEDEDGFFPYMPFINQLCGK